MHDLHISLTIPITLSMVVFITDYYTRIRGLQRPGSGRLSVRMRRDMVKLRTSVILKELRFPPSSGRAKLTRSATMMSTLGRISVTIVLKGLMDMVT